MDDAASLLQQLGFAEYEAKAYVALLGRGTLNGYELAKVSGLPRANVYGVLQKLEERGAVLRVDTLSGTRYSAVPSAELIPTLGERFRESLGRAKRALEGLAAPAEREQVFNAEGYETLLEQARSLLARAGRRALIALWPQEARTLAVALAQAEARGVEVTTLCMAACRQECGNCRGHIFRYAVAETGGARWLVVTADGDEALVGEVRPDGRASMVRTRQRLLVELAGGYVRHSIALASILHDAGDLLDGLLGDEARRAMAAAGPTDGAAGWLDHMRGLLARPGPDGGQ